MGYLHLRGVQGFVTLNTLVFPSEIDLLEKSVRAVVSAGVDAAIVQDVGAARLIRAIAPTFHSRLDADVDHQRRGRRNGRAAGHLPRRARPRTFDRGPLPHTAAQDRGGTGSLCPRRALHELFRPVQRQLSAWAAAAPTAGSCAQQCRLPYELVCDDEVRDLQDRKYLLSPSDLSALDLVPRLIAAGVSWLKIEGRMKPPEYVASATRQYRHAIDEGLAGRAVLPPPEELLELESPFSRGLSHGWLAGRNLADRRRPQFGQSRHPGRQGRGCPRRPRGGGACSRRFAAATALPFPPSSAKHTTRVAASMRSLQRAAGQRGRGRAGGAGLRPRRRGI